MTEVAQQQGPAIPLAALFTGFLIVSLCGIGGGSGIVWARRIAVENRRWINDRECRTRRLWLALMRRLHAHLSSAAVAGLLHPAA
jgi:hypothetical protein